MIEGRPEGDRSWRLKWGRENRGSSTVIKDDRVGNLK